MKRIRILSSKFLRDLTARRIDLAGEDLAVKVVISRSFWVGPQDHDSWRDHRRAQILGFGLIDEAELARAVATLEERGWLLPPAEAAAELDPDHAGERAQLLEAQARLSAIMQLAETIGGDVGGLGRHALPAAGGALAQRLAAVQVELEAIADALHAARAPFLAEQAARLDLATARDLKVHLGAGGTRLEGWINCDVSPSELSFNVSWGLPFADGSVAVIYAGHVFEHLYYGAEALGLLREVKRVLAPGGVFRFIVPDVGLYLRKYAEGNRGFFDHWRMHAVKYFALFDTPMELVMLYCMVGRDPSEIFGHKMGYDLETIEKLARRAGFAAAVRSDYMASAHPALRVDEISAAANLAYEGERYSLFVELVA